MSSTYLGMSIEGVTYDPSTNHRNSFPRMLRSMATNTINKYSGQITQPKSQGASQAMRTLYIHMLTTVYATGLTDEDLSKAQVGISRYHIFSQHINSVCNFSQQQQLT